MRFSFSKSKQVDDDKMQASSDANELAVPYPLRSSEAARPVRRPFLRGVETRRVEEFSSEQFSQYNIHSVMFQARRDDEKVIKLELWDPPAGAKPSFEEAKKQKYEPVKAGHMFGPSWSNHWLKVLITVPEEWRQKEWVELEFDPSCEAMIFNEDGLPLQGITGGSDARRVDFPLKPEMRKGVLLYIEVTCNGLFGLPIGSNGPDPNRFFKLASATIVVKNPEAWHLFWDYVQLKGCIDQMPQDSVLQNKALWTMQQIQNTFRTGNLETVRACRKIAEEVYGTNWFQRGAKVYEDGNVFGKDDYKLCAVGHTHIDSAWLWPFTATQQKVARSWSTQLDLMDRYPEFKFTASTAQQYAWLEQYYPKLFTKLQGYVKSGRFLPIGGTWVENDANMPGGEAFIRQFLYGQRYFKSRFGSRCNIFWLPDTFGYNSQIPQIARGCGTDYFFTQKLSWSNINRFPHNTMMWTGLDGTQIITHMTPVNNYDSMGGVDDIRRGITNNQNLGVQPIALLLYGKGDGGGGPSSENIEKLRRARAIYNNGYTDMPKVSSNLSPNDFFENVRKSTNNGERLPTWNGEVYLEFHRGVYTSHGSIKEWNRKLEILLQIVEWTATLASIQDGTNYKYPKEQLDAMWEPFLLCQFHDVLPGSSIRLVYDDAEKIYADVNKKAHKLLEEASLSLQASQSVGTGSAVPSAFHNLGAPRRELVSIPRTSHLMKQSAATITPHVVQEAADSVLVVMEDAHGSGRAQIVQSPLDLMRDLEAVSVGESAHGGVTIKNNAVALSVNDGRISSLQILSADNEWLDILAPGRTGGLSICQDYPPQFDAWETDVYSLDTDEEIKFDSVRVAQRGAWRSTIELTSSFGRSKATLRMSLDALPASHIATSTGSRPAARDARSLFRFDAEIDWQEKHKFLRFELPTIIRSDLASYETQFGVTKRPAYRNTSWDAAKFEVCGHKFADLSETQLGVSLLTNSKYGYSVEGGLMRISLLKGATYPDAHQDEGKHNFAFAIYPHLSTLEASDVVHVGRIFNAPLLLDNDRAPSTATADLPIWLEAPSGQAAKVRPVILDTIKRAEEDFPYAGREGAKSKSIIVRMYESLGSHSRAVLATTLPLKDVCVTNMLEDSDRSSKLNTMAGEDAASKIKTTKIVVNFLPFQVVTLKIQL